MNTQIITCNIMSIKKKDKCFFKLQIASRFTEQQTQACPTYKLTSNNIKDINIIFID